MRVGHFIGPRSTMATTTHDCITAAMQRIRRLQVNDVHGRTRGSSARLRGLAEEEASNYVFHAHATAANLGHQLHVPHDDALFRVEEAMQLHGWSIKHILLDDTSRHAAGAYLLRSTEAHGAIWDSSTTGAPGTPARQPAGGRQATPARAGVIT